ncbi:hypothetical protein FSP39_013646 [Pinctada imbricata]|uniref:Methyltransferase domain-containing protein n=1 Tax=Pinctada imbricata TaxID=66713 RepID=A0AA88Y471_PINIB|nr:hypothetical protein FSP39_013646 [Pinctada imbricata]
MTYKFKVNAYVTVTLSYAAGKAIKLMDLGCGSGAVSFEIAKHIPDIEIVGIDENESVIANANKRAQSNGLKSCSFEHCKGEDMSEKYNGSIDVVLLMDVLHDMADSDACMQSIRKILKPGGYIVAFDPPLHSNPRLNKGDLTYGGFYFISLFICLPNSLSRDAAIGHGMGWGYEDRKKYIEDWGFKICKLSEEEDVDEIKMRIVGQMI